MSDSVYVFMCVCVLLKMNVKCMWPEEWFKRNAVNVMNYLQDFIDISPYIHFLT